MGRLAATRAARRGLLVALAGSLYLASTAAFAVIALVIGVRLLLLSRRTAQAAEATLGLALLLTAGLGYGVMIFAMLGRTAAGGEDAPAFFTWLVGLGWISHNVGVLCWLRFVLLVFRPGAAWAKALALGMAGVLWVGFVFYVAAGGLRDGVPRTSYWVMQAVTGTYPLWVALEAFAYHAQMRRRLALGLADALVTNRFLLWGFASILAAAAIWTVNVPALAGYAPLSEEAQGLVAVTMFFTSLFGTGTVCMYWLTFFPPAWYRARFASTVPAAKAS